MASQSSSEPLPPVIYAISGSAASVVANALIYPLDQVKTKLQAQSTQDIQNVPKDAYYNGVFDAITKITRTEGFIGLYAGMPGSLLGSAWQGYVFNYWHSLLRQFYLSSTALPQPPGTMAELLLAFGSGALAQVFTIPVSVVTTRQQTALRHERKGLVGTANEIVRGEDGVVGLWKGLRAGIILCVNPAITYGATERLRGIFFQGRENLKPWESFLLGVVSKAMATVVSQPMIVARVGLQSRPPMARKGKPFKTFGEVIAYIVEHEGVLRLFKGLGPQLSKALLVQGILMILKERFRTTFGLLYIYLHAYRDRRFRKSISGKSLGVKTAMPIIIK